MTATQALRGWQKKQMAAQRKAEGVVGLARQQFAALYRDVSIEATPLFRARPLKRQLRRHTLAGMRRGVAQGGNYSGSDSAFSYYHC